MKNTDDPVVSKQAERLRAYYKAIQRYNEKNYVRVDMKIRPADKKNLQDGAKKFGMSLTSFILYMCSPEKQAEEEKRRKEQEEQSKREQSEREQSEKEQGGSEQADSESPSETSD